MADQKFKTQIDLSEIYYSKVLGSADFKSDGWILKFVMPNPIWHTKNIQIRPI